ncbi:hypothetical protein ACFOSC_30125 [Streptantibioticus rubrisoli]|uniref:DUF2127 domain-containing protein n=1 Tax=Streptantibioticus rubrisoli TaxID=1387313 RepID=A0ABT1PGM3_9ACTN|nr:hypothetical protein [Streptantibioticus rubrisoli]MCQ4044516.1 hypothetical protein [Streptantibioticus rubrisoli]
MKEPQAPLPPRWPLLLFRTIATLEALLSLAETSLAGSFLNGHYDMLKAHRITAMVIVAVAVVQAVAAFLVRRAGRVPAWLLPTTLLLLIALVGQTGLGFSRVLAAHVTLGVIVVACLLLLTGWSWRTPLPAADGGRHTEAADEPIGVSS